MQKDSQRTTKTRVFESRSAGIPKKSDAPFWRGERAETIVERRASIYATEKLAKLEARNAKRSAKKKHADYTKRARPKSQRERTPNQQLRRLERQLARRKTLAARQRLQARIKELKREIDS